MAIGKFQGVIRPTTPTGSRVTSTSTPGRTEGSFSPGGRRHSPEKNRKICAARTVSATPSASVLPSSRASRRPSSSLRARISSPTRLRISWRSWMVDCDQAGKACLAAAIARCASAALARGNSPTISLVLDGLMSGAALALCTHSPAMKFLNGAVIGLLPWISSWRQRGGHDRAPRGAEVEPGVELRQPMGLLALRRDRDLNGGAVHVPTPEHRGSDKLARDALTTVLRQHIEIADLAQAAP